MSAKTRYLKKLKNLTTQCYYCDIVCTSENVSVEHIIPKTMIKSDTVLNLTAACNNCNKLRGKITEFILTNRKTLKNQTLLSKYIELWNQKVISKHKKSLNEFKQELDNFRHEVIRFYYDIYGYR